jgi:phage terminase large subunit-like protein
MSSMTQADRTRFAPDNPADQYACDVVDGLVPAGKYHRLACERHILDRLREDTPGFPYRFVWELCATDADGRVRVNKQGQPILTQCAQKFLRFAGRLRHYKGRQFAGQFFTPTPCQMFTLGSLFGWRHVKTGLRRFTTSYKEVPRKQGKSFEEAVVAIYVTFYEGEAGAEGYCIATKEKQAKISFSAAKRLVKSSGLAKHIKVNAANLHRESTECKLEAIGSDSDTTDGLNPHFVGVDELHAFKVRGLLDVMESATGARLNPMIFQITTAGDDPVSVCGDQHAYACQILDGTLEDDPSTLSFFAFISHADEGDDPWAESTWIKANPHWGVSVDPDDMRKLAAKAMKMPSAAGEFKQKRLNMWVNATAPCLSVEGWRKGQSQGWKPALEVPALKHEPCYVGIDLASKIDLCAVTFAFPPVVGRPKWRWLQQVWTPADSLQDRAHRDRAPYGVWAEQGWLQTTPGVRIDQQVILDVILSAREFYDIQLIGYDEWHADKLIEDLKKEIGQGADEMVLPVSQTFRGMSSACLRVQADILAGEVDAGGCPVTAWCVGNAVPNTDGKDNLMFAKGKSRGRIDPVISGTIATALYLKQPPATDETPQMLFFGGTR